LANGMTEKDGISDMPTEITYPGAIHPVGLKAERPVDIATAILQIQIDIDDNRVRSIGERRR